MPEALTPAGQIIFDMINLGRGDYHDLLGMKVVDYRQGWGKLMLPYNPALVGNPDTGVLHGGVITSLLDSCMGFTVATTVPDITICPTLDLRIDYMSPAQPGLPVYAEAEVYRTTRHVLFVRGKAYQADREQPVAYTTAAFARLGAASAAAIEDYVRHQQAAGEVPQ